MRVIKPWVNEIDDSTVGVLRLQLSAIPPRQSVVIDLSEVRFMDGHGLRALLVAQERHSQAGGSLSVIHPYGTSLVLLRTTGMSEALIYGGSLCTRTTRPSPRRSSEPSERLPRCRQRSGFPR